MRKNAGLKSAKEALAKMLDGVIFYYYDYQIYWDEKETQFCVRYIDSTEKGKLNSFLENYAHWELEAKWWEVIPSGGILCEHTTKENEYCVITHADSDGYMGYYKINGNIVISVYNIGSYKPVSIDTLNGWIENATK